MRKIATTFGTWLCVERLNSECGLMHESVHLPVGVDLEEDPEPGTTHFANFDT